MRVEFCVRASSEKSTATSLSDAVGSFSQRTGGLILALAARASNGRPEIAQLICGQAATATGTTKPNTMAVASRNNRIRRVRRPSQS